MGKARAVAHAISSQVPRVGTHGLETVLCKVTMAVFFFNLEKYNNERFGVMIAVICVADLYLCFLFCHALRLDCVLYFYLGKAEIRVHL